MLQRRREGAWNCELWSDPPPTGCCQRSASQGCELRQLQWDVLLRVCACAGPSTQTPACCFVSCTAPAFPVCWCHCPCTVLFLPLPHGYWVALNLRMIADFVAPTAKLRPRQSTACTAWAFSGADPSPFPNFPSFWVSLSYQQPAFQSLGAEALPKLPALDAPLPAPAMDQVGQTRPGRLGEQPPAAASAPGAAAAPTNTARQEIDKALGGAHVVVFSKSVCPKCKKSKEVRRGVGASGGFRATSASKEKQGGVAQGDCCPAACFRPPRTC